MKIAVNSFLFVLALFLFSSCGQKSVFDNQATINNGKWFKNDAVHFEVNIEDTTKLYDFYLTLRHTTDYRFSNLYLFLATQFPNNNLTHDTLELILADNSGKWLGKGWSDIKEDNILLRNNLKFPLRGKYDFYFRQAMRRDTLEDVVNIGIRISESQ
jgi:gliding motility-associated lipoprotein GldH